MEERQAYRAVLYAPGLRQPVKKVEPFLGALAERGVEIISSESRSLFTRRNLDDEFSEQRGAWPSIQLAKANGLYRALTDSGVERADVVGFCEGGVTGTILASIHPEAVDQLVLVNSAGLTKEDGSKRLVDRFKDKNKRYTKAIFEDIISGKIEHSTFRMTEANINRILGMRALASLADVYMVDTLIDLMENGVEVSVVQGYKDGLYPYESVVSNVPEGVRAHATFADRSTGHSALETHTHDAIDIVSRILDLQ